MKNTWVLIFLIFAVAVKAVPVQIKNDTVKVHVNAADSSLRISQSLTTNPSALNISIGNIEGYSSIHKFGDNGDIDQAREDIWSFGDTLITNDTGKTYYMSSSDAGDGQIVEVQGLDSLFQLQVLTDTINGQTKTVLCDTAKWTRIFRVKNLGSTDNAGNWYFYQDCGVSSGVPDSADSVQAYVAAGNNQTLQAIFTVPAGKTAYLTKWYCSVSRSITTGGADVEMRARPFGGVFQVKEYVSLMVTGSSTYAYIFPTPIKYVEKTDIKITASSTALNTGVSAGFDLVLIDN